MSRNVLLALVVLVALYSKPAIHAAIIHESATLGPTGIDFPILALDYDQFFGSRFSVTEPVQVAMVGGHIKARFRPLFAAIVSLASPTAFPSGSPFDSTTLATTLIDAPSTSADVLSPLSVRLDPGNYALIFGAGLFGASNNGGGIADNNVDIPGHASYFVWGDSSAHPNVFSWRNYNYGGPNGGGLRFVVTGTVIPEPSTLALLAISIAPTLWIRRRAGSHCWPATAGSGNLPSSALPAITLWSAAKTRPAMFPVLEREYSNYTASICRSNHSRIVSESLD